MSLRSCQIETSEPVLGTTIGTIPKWLEGTLVKNCAGMFKVGEQTYKHFFDGLALLQTFKISEGSITYFNKFLQSDRFKTNTSAKRIVLGEFGTNIYPDPCDTVWGRSNTKFTSSCESDNCNSNVCPYNDELYAVAETKYIWKIDAKTYESVEKVDLSKYVAVNHATSHPHVDEDGTLWNIGNSYSQGSFYNLIRFPPVKKGSSISSFDKATIFASIPSRWSSQPGYIHSFSITENYIVLIEQPFVMVSEIEENVEIHGESVNGPLRWYSDQKAVFHVIDKHTGVSLPQKFVSDVSFTFYHTINAYEEDSHIVVDLCAYDSGNFVKAFYLDLQGDYDPNECLFDKFAKAWRFVLPLKATHNAQRNENLITLKGTSCTGVEVPDEKSIICSHELFKDIWCELPAINYDYDGKKYSYFYTIGADGSLMKMDWQTGSVVYWKDENYWPTSPIFVSKPDGFLEDEGVVLSVLVKHSAPEECTLVVLDGQTFTELGRSSFTTNDTVPLVFHGVFIPSNTSIPKY